MMNVEGEIGKVIGLDCSGFSREQWHGAEECFRFSGGIALPDQAYRDAYFDTLAHLCGLSHSWKVEAPHECPDDRFDFSGSSDQTTISGVEYVEFAVIRRGNVT